MNAGSSSHGSCLVLGARGFVGSAVVAEARSRGYDVIPVDQEYEAAMGRKVDLLVNANGNSRKYLSRQDPALDFDLSVRSVARSFEDFSFRRYVHLSSIDVYPDLSDPMANDETAPIDPARVSTYGFHKYLAEQVVRHRAPAWLILRMGGFVGPGLWKNSVHDLLKGGAIRVHPDSAYQYLHTRDLARILFDLAEGGRDREVLNVAGDGLIRLREIAAWIPGCRLPDEEPALPTERYEVNLARLKSVHAVPKTAATVRQFVEDVLSGKEAIR